MSALQICKTFLLQHAIKRKFKSKGEKHDHWLDFASDKFEKQLIEDVKRVLSVSFVFIPLPVFWALYDQQVNKLPVKHKASFTVISLFPNFL